MPTYEYDCNKCGKEFEEFQSITSEPFADCPECGTKSKRKFSVGGGIIFKGSGFYVNDYKNKNAGSKSKSNSSSSNNACASCPNANN